MGLFSSKKTVGSMRLDFHGQNELAVTDRVPEGGDVPYPVLFGFLFADDVLAQYPGDRSALLAESIARLSDRIDPSDPLARNESLLGVFCAEAPTILEAETGGASWVCEGTLLEKSGDLSMDARIASGFGDSLHRASMDAAFETARVRLGDKGGAVGAAALEYLRALSESDRGSADSNRAKAHAAAARAAKAAGLAS